MLFRSKPKKEKTEAEKKQAKCPVCGHLWPANTDCCPACGHVRAKRSEIIAVPGELEELGGSATRDVKQSWYSQLLHIQIDRGYSLGWLANKYREKFGVWPRGLAEISTDPSVEVLRWEKSRRIAWAKSRKAA